MTQNSFQFEAKIPLIEIDKHVTAILTCNASTCLFWLAIGD